MKNELRKQFLQQRNNISAQEIEENSMKICQRIIQLPEFSECETIFTYYSFGSEVAPKILIEHAWEFGKKVCIPKVVGKNIMDFYYIEKNQPLKLNNYGILEPTDKSVKAFPDKKTMFIIPGLVFDKNKYRVGYGGGYYDAYLAECEFLVKLGICFDFQVVENAEPNNHDIPVDMIITEKNIY